MIRKTTNGFITEAKQIHGDRYNYSLVEYINAHTKVKIKCSIHGVFEQKPNDHLNNHGCPSCGGVKKIDSFGFITKAKQIHGDRYDYSLVRYKNNKIKISIICPKHGVFKQRPDDHLNNHGCPVCANDTKKLTIDDFITKAKQIHSDRYDYSLVEYTNNYTKINIICPIHGVFSQKPSGHLKGNGCYLCGGKAKLSIDDFISRSRQVHGDLYRYDLIEYIDSRTKVKIMCPEHGVFEQRPDGHLKGNRCPVCSNKISRQEIDLLNYIKSIYDGEIVTNTRKIIHPYELDIYLPDIHKAFEYNGMYWHNEGLNKPIGYHQMKNDLCAHRGINLTHIWEHDWLENNRFMREMVRREVVL